MNLRAYPTTAVPSPFLLISPHISVHSYHLWQVLKGLVRMGTAFTIPFVTFCSSSGDLTGFLMPWTSYSDQEELKVRVTKSLCRLLTTEGVSLSPCMKLINYVLGWYTEKVLWSLQRPCTKSLSVLTPYPNKLLNHRCHLQ